MSKSLRDQLVSAGLATKAQANKAERQARAGSKKRDKEAAQAKTDGAGSKTADTESRKRARNARSEKSSQDKAAAKVRNEKAAARALRHEMRQLIFQHDQRSKEVNDDDVAYNFLHNNKVKRIYVPRAQQEALSRGDLIVVNNDGLYHLVPREIADRIAKRDPRRIVGRQEETADGEKTAAEKARETELDEYYKDFEVPDDLDW